MKEQKVAVPFLIAAVAWAAAGYGACKYFSADAELLRKNLFWLFGLWSLCLFDLVALAKTVQGLLAFAGGSAEVAENRAAYVIQTFSWGLIKLACLGIFALVMIKGKAIPNAGLLAGMGTLVVVPLVGGLIWSEYGRA